MSKIVIEVLSSTVHGQRYHSFNKSVVKIGRSYGCDLILDDPFVSPEHVTVSYVEGGLIVKDLASENGTVIAKEVLTEKYREIKSGTTCSIGRTRIRIFSGKHAIPETQRINFTVQLNEFMRRPVFVAVTFASAILLVCWYGLLQEDPLTFWERDIYAYIFGLMGIVFCTSAAMALYNMFKHKKPALGRQISMMSIVAILVLLLFMLEPFIGFYTASFMPEWVIPVLFILFIVFFGSFLDRGRTLKKDYALAVAAAAGMYFMIMSGQFGYSAHPDYNYFIAPYAMPLSAPLSLDQFLLDSQAVFDIEISQKK